MLKRLSINVFGKEPSKKEEQTDKKKPNTPSVRLKSTRLVSHRIPNGGSTIRRSAAAQVDAGTPSRQARAAILDHLTKYQDALKQESRGDALAAFEELVIESLVDDVMDDVQLIAALRQLGWKGHKFDYSPAMALDVNAAWVAMSTLYMQVALLSMPSLGGGKATGDTTQSTSLNPLPMETGSLSTPIPSRRPSMLSIATATVAEVIGGIAGSGPPSQIHTPIAGSRRPSIGVPLPLTGGAASGRQQRPSMGTSPVPTSSGKGGTEMPPPLDPEAVLEANIVTFCPNMLIRHLLTRAGDYDVPRYPTIPDTLRSGDSSQRIAAPPHPFHVTPSPVSSHQRPGRERVVVPGRLHARGHFRLFLLLRLHVAEGRARARRPPQGHKRCVRRRHALQTAPANHHAPPLIIMYIHPATYRADAAPAGFLGHFVDMVHLYQGDVVSFAGDALVCVFLDESGGATSRRNSSNTSSAAARTASFSSSFAGLARRRPTYADQNMASNYCLRALQCACELRKHRDDNLGTHIGVTAGTLTFAVLGGHMDEYTYVVNGACLAELSQCIDDAGRSEVVCTEECYNLATTSAKLVKATPTFRVAEAEAEAAEGKQTMLVLRVEDIGWKVPDAVDRTLRIADEEVRLTHITHITYITNATHITRTTHTTHITHIAHHL